MKMQKLMILMLACAILFAFDSCKKDEVANSENISNDGGVSPNGGVTPLSDYVIENAVTDVDGNTYRAVKLGNQVWMAENLRTTRYANGNNIPISSGSNPSTTTGLRYYPDNDESYVSTYGYLYNWPAVMNGASPSESNPSGVQGICPTGWHMPSDAEWTQLTNYVSSRGEYVCGDDSSYIGRALASTTGWESSIYNCAAGSDQSTNNATGFSAFPAGCYVTYDFFNSLGTNAYFWSATQLNEGYAYCRILGFHDRGVRRENEYKRMGYSVRCVRN